MRAFPSLLATLLVLAAATPALAQDGPPGACECAVPAAPPPAAPEGWDGRRWSVGVHVASIGLTDEATGVERELGGGGFQARYRVNARWELEFSTDSAEEKDAATARTFGAGTIAALYHLRPYRRWDVFLLGGFGGASFVEDGDRATAEHHGLIAAAVGVERHFGRLGVVAELRLLGLSPAEEDVETRGDAMPAVVGEQPREGLSGGRFSLAASYRF